MKRSMGLALNIALGNTGGILGRCVTLKTSLGYQKLTRLTAISFLILRKVKVTPRASVPALPWQPQQCAAPSSWSTHTGVLTRRELLFLRRKSELSTLKMNSLLWETSLLFSDTSYDYAFSKSRTMGSQIIYWRASAAFRNLRRARFIFSGIIKKQHAVYRFLD